MPAAPTPAVRPGAVLAVLSAAAFMASLDLFIVNVALPEVGRDLGDDLTGRPELDAERLRDRLRRAAGPVRPAGRPLRAQGRLPARRRGVHAGQRRLRGQRLPGTARRLPGPPGGRGRAAHADQPRPPARRDAGGRPRPRGAHLGRVGSAGRGRGTGAGRRPRRRVLALGLPHQPADRSPGHRPGRPDRAAVPGRRPDAAARPGGRGDPDRRDRRPRDGPGEGPGLGLGERADARVAGDRRRGHRLVLAAFAPASGPGRGPRAAQGPQLRLRQPDGGRLQRGVRRQPARGRAVDAGRLGLLRAPHRARCRGRSGDGPDLRGGGPADVPPHRRRMDRRGRVPALRRRRRRSPPSG